MNKLRESECTLGSVFNKLNEVIAKINTIPTISKVEVPKEKLDAEILNKKIIELNTKIDNIITEFNNLKHNLNDNLNKIVDSVNDNFEALDKRIDNAGK